MIKTHHDEIWYWYEKVQEFMNSAISQRKYCHEHNVDYKKFPNMYYRIIYKTYSDPKLYESLVPLVRKYMSSETPAHKFAKDHGIHSRILTEMVMHLGYLDIIEKMKSEKEAAKMKFIQVPPMGSVTVPTMNLPMITQQEHKVVEKQNDIEINITKGVKVSISPNIDSMKIIKIIELLKDL